jgi:hypothetical protein
MISLIFMRNAHLGEELILLAFYIPSSILAIVANGGEV